MVKNFMISLDDWILKDIVGENNVNRSARIKELLIKGYICDEIMKKKCEGENGFKHKH
jgi:hypothetical protein